MNMNSDSKIEDDFHLRAISSFRNQLLLTQNVSVVEDAEAAAAVVVVEVEEVESYAQFLVEDDTPKIDSAVKAYLCLVAARSAVQSDIDVISTSSLMALSASSASSVSSSRAAADDEEDRQCCTFADSADANRCALICARTLLSTINSLLLPSSEYVTSDEGYTNANDAEAVMGAVADNDGDNENNRKMKQQQKLRNDTIRIIWNKVANKTPLLRGDTFTQSKTAVNMKPSKVLGRHSLLVAYPYVQERFRRGISLLSRDENVQQIDTTTVAAHTSTTVTSPSECQPSLPLHSLSNDLLPPVLPPKGIDVDKWKSFYLEFGRLLVLSSLSSSSSSNAMMKEDEVQPNDSALLWSKDGGAAELQSRRVNRTRRAAEALAFDSGTVREGENNE